jgi:hypothetical protein
MPVAQPVEHQREKFSAGGDVANVGYPAGPARLSRCTASIAAHRSSGSPCLVICPPVHGGVGLPVAWGQPSPGAQLLRAVETGAITDLGNEDRRMTMET